MSNKEFRIDSDSPAAADMMFWSVVGHEAFSRPSVYELTVLSKVQDLQSSEVLGRAFDVVISFADESGAMHERHCHGHAVRFVRLGGVGRLFEYRIVLRSWFWLLSKRKNSRILQDKKTLECFEAVLEDSPLARVKKLASDKVIETSYVPHRYCVQYQETDYHYVSRLLEADGIYYWFDAEDAPGTMNLADSSAAAHEKLKISPQLKFVPEGVSEARFAEIYSWRNSRVFDTGKHATRDSNFKAFKTTLGASIDVSDEHELADLECFEFPGDYFSAKDADEQSKVRGDELLGRREQHWGVTSWPEVTVGRGFRFSGDPDGVREGDYLIAACTFAVCHPGYESIQRQEESRPVAQTLQEMVREDAVNAHVLDELMALIRETHSLAVLSPGGCTFLMTALPAATPYRPQRLTPQVQMPGPQVGVVVGAEGKEIEVDEFGRVKVHFMWDRYDKSNEKSTCWVRVSQPWAGKSWGGYFAPRIGQEVIVDFINGDPDRPIIMGRVYNSDQPIPYTSPTQSGFKTRSTPGGGPDNYNEILFEDKKGDENINIHAEKNMSRSVENDDSLSVGRDQTETVKRDRVSRVERNENTTVAEKQSNLVGVRQENTVGRGGQYNEVEGFQENKFHNSQKTSVKGSQKLIVTGGRETEIGGDQSVIVGASQTITVGGDHETVVGAQMKLESGSDIKIHASGMRKDITANEHSLMANSVKAVSNTNIDLMAVANINFTSVGSNTVVLGSNSGGYIGTNSEANIGITRSTFMGMSMSNAMALNMSNFLGVQMENVAAVKMDNCAGPHLTQEPLQIDLATVQIKMGGSGAASGAGAAAAGSVMAYAAGAISVLYGGTDVAGVVKSYAEAESALATAAEEAKEQGLNGLSERLGRLARIANRRHREGGAQAVGGPIWVAAGVIAETIGGTAATRSSAEIAGETPTNASTGSAPGAGN